MGSIRITTRYAHPPERVWSAITEPDLLRAWMLESDFEPVVGRACRFVGEPAPGWDGVVHAEVIEADPPRSLAYTWRGGLIDTVVRYTLEGDRSSTRLVFEQTGFRGWRGGLVRLVLARGAKTMLRKRLAAVLDDMADPASDGMRRGLAATLEQDCSTHVVRSAIGHAAAAGAKPGGREQADA